MARRKIPTDTETDLLLTSKRRCALCFGLNGDIAQKPGQIAHIDRDSSNSALDNLCYLCLEHHNEYDAKPAQSKAIQQAELKRYRDMMYEHLKGIGPRWPDAPLTGPSVGSENLLRVPMDVYERRLAMYKTVAAFMSRIVQEASVELDEIKDFARDSEEAIFLFDEPVAQYFAEIYRKSVSLRTTLKLMDHTTPGEHRSSLSIREMELLEWFNDQMAELRSRVKPFMNLS